MRRSLVIAPVALGLAACAGILGLRSDGRRPFPHRAHVLAGTSCVKCHPGADTAGDDAPLHFPDDASCLECHSKPHDRRSCLGCHGGPWTAVDAMQAREHLRFDHRRHQDTTRGNCVRCHAGIQEPGQLLRPAMAVCLKCHEHEGDFQVRACKRCHVDLAEENTPPASHLVHGGDFIRTHGARAASSADLCSTCHAERFCAGCHGVDVPALPARIAFDSPGQASVHRAGLRLAARDRGEGAAGHLLVLSSTGGLSRLPHRPPGGAGRRRGRRAGQPAPARLGRAEPERERARAGRAPRSGRLRRLSWRRRRGAVRLLPPGGRRRRQHPSARLVQPTGHGRVAVQALPRERTVNRPGACAWVAVRVQPDREAP